MAWERKEFGSAKRTVEGYDQLSDTDMIMSNDTGIFKALKSVNSSVTDYN